MSEIQTLDNFFIKYYVICEIKTTYNQRITNFIISKTCISNVTKLIKTFTLHDLPAIIILYVSDKIQILLCMII